MGTRGASFSYWTSRLKSLRCRNLQHRWSLPFPRWLAVQRDVIAWFHFYALLPSLPPHFGHGVSCVSTCSNIWLRKIWDIANILSCRHGRFRLLILWVFKFKNCGCRWAMTLAAWLSQWEHRSPATWVFLRVLLIFFIPHHWCRVNENIEVP